MKGLFAPIVYLIVLLFHFNGVQAMKLLIDLEDSQLLGPTPCNSASDCQHLESAVCVKSYCECNGTKFCPSQLENKVLKLGQLCNQSSECIIENSICEEGKCSCKQGTVEHMDGGRCLMEENSKSNSTNKCTKEGCKCDTGYVSNYASTNCLEIAEKLNSACDEDLQCIANFENSICHQSSCQCIQGYRYNANANMCIKDSSSDVRSQDETDGFASAGCVDGICKEDHDEVQLSMDAEEPCIGPLCNGFQKKQENNCTVGRCECPEERKFCTNQARPRHSSYKPMLVHQVDEEPEEDVTKAPPKQHYLHSSVIEQILLEKVVFDDNTEVLILAYCQLLNSLFLYWALYALKYAPSHTKHYFSTVMIPRFIFFSGLSVLWIFGFRTTMFVVVGTAICMTLVNFLINYVNIFFYKILYFWLIIIGHLKRARRQQV